MSIAKAVEAFIDSHPSVKDCISSGLINYSSLARKIARDTGLGEKENFDALVVACRRYFGKKRRASALLEEKIMSLLRKCNLEIKNKIAVFIIEKSIPRSVLNSVIKSVSEEDEDIHIIQGSKTISIIAPDESILRHERALKPFLVNKKTCLVGITVKTSAEIDTTPGVMDFLYSLFGQNGINIFETMSSWTDTLFVIAEKDLPKTMQLLRFK